MYVLIIEDNPSKVANIFAEYDELLRNKTVFVTPSIILAKSWLHDPPCHPAIVFLDFELPPGMGNGKNFLEEVNSDLVSELYLTSMSPFIVKEMVQIARNRGMGSKLRQFKSWLTTTS